MLRKIGICLFKDLSRAAMVSIRVKDSVAYDANLEIDASRLTLALK